MMHWLIVGVILIVVFGPKRLPDLGASLGKSMREFKRSFSGSDEAERPALPPASQERSAGAGAQVSEPARTDAREPKRLSR